MNNIILKTRYKVFYVSPKIITYCIFQSKYVDYTQWGSNKHHPHAGDDRGVFKEDPEGFIKINNSNWDYKPGILFSKLLEFKALMNHYNGKENWKKSEFAIRYLNYLKIQKIKKDRNISDIRNFLSKREKQIDRLFNSILKKGVYLKDLKKNKKSFIDNISVVLTKNKKLYFNNRGHHRLSISKILGLKKIPVKITLAKSKKDLKEFNLSSV
mgnify:FL=1